MKPNIYFLRFCVQVGFSSVVLTFCIYQLLTGGITRDGKDGAIYWGGLTTILGWWMPVPARLSWRSSCAAEKVNVKNSTT